VLLISGFALAFRLYRLGLRKGEQYQTNSKRPNLHLSFCTAKMARIGLFSSSNVLSKIWFCSASASLFALMQFSILKFA
jgi:hypothetical protein